MAKLTAQWRAWLHLAHRTKRTLGLRLSYRRLLLEAPRTPRERARFHIEHLGEYWERCIGFLSALPAVDRSFLDGDLVACISVATAVAHGDIRAVAEDDFPLLPAWGEYRIALGAAVTASAEIAVALRAAESAFARVKAVHASLPGAA
jgi:hypothetical protein